MHPSENKNAAYQSFIFTHIPKCGGTSFRTFIYDAGLGSGIDNSHIYIPGKDGLKFNKNIIGLSEDEIQAVQLRPLKILACHAHYNVHRRFGLSMNVPFYYTIFREPVARTISHYNHFVFKGNDDRYKNRQLKDLETDELEDILKTQSNLQTCYLADVTGGHSLTESDLDQAKKNLSVHYPCFGILERMEVSIRLIRQCAPTWLRLERAFPHERKNEASLRDPALLGDKTKDIIRYMNRYDIALYEFAQSLFLQRCAENKIPV